jgi:hypothetical protein
VSLNTAKALRRAAEEERRLAAFFKALQRLIPEPPDDWRCTAKPPGSTPRTSGRPGTAS